MSDVFEPKELEVKDVYRLGTHGTEREVIYADSQGRLIQELAGIRRWISLDTRVENIRRVVRNGVQIFPPPECPFSAGDRARDKFDASAKIVTVDNVSWCTSNKCTPHWRIQFTNIIPGDAVDAEPLECQTDAPADGYGLVPPEPAWVPKPGEWVMWPNRGNGLNHVGTVAPGQGREERITVYTAWGGILYPLRADLKPYEPPVDAIKRILIDWVAEAQAEAMAEAICDACEIIILKESTDATDA